MTIENTIKTIEALDIVSSVNFWRGKRAYINLTAADRSFAGCRTHQLYIDMVTGQIVDQMGKGTTPRAFDEQRAALKEAMQ